SYLSILLACLIRMPHSPVVPGLMLMNSAGSCAWLRPCRGLIIRPCRTTARDEEIQDADISSLRREVVRQLALETLLHSVNLAEDLSKLKKVAAQLNVDEQVIDELVKPGYAHHTLELRSEEHTSELQSRLDL